MVRRALLVGGTSSHAGKSWMATAICRHLRRRGLRVAPFKAQNMSLNSYPCRNGGEIGRAQVVQAEACGLEPASDMNPVLLKPNGEGSSQVVVDGKVWRNLRAAEYYEHFDFLLGRVLAAWERLAARYDYIVMEGAGSVAEVNLRARDLVNLGLARRVGAPALLVADIDRGGVFASVAGTFGLLEAEEAPLVPAFAINRFRGDASLFAGGIRFLEDKTGRKCLGLFPYEDSLAIDPEDGLSLDGMAPAAGTGPRVGILRFPRVSNFTDFRLLPRARWIRRPEPGRFDCVILPGSKNTLADLAWMRARGLDRWVLAQHAQGARVVGICGGYQMLGERIDDPHGVESEAGASASGLGLLPVVTMLAPEKTTRVVEAATPAGRKFRAYEIHMGLTRRPPDCAPFAVLAEGDEGIRARGCVGTYLHGALEDPGVLEELLGTAVEPGEDKEVLYDRLADWFERHADLRLFEELYL